MEPDGLSAILWRQREAVDDLLYRLVVERLVLSAGDHRWAGFAAEEVHGAVERLRSIDTERSLAASAVAAGLGLPCSATLRQLTDAVAEPWRYILDDHHRALTEAVEEATRLGAVNERLLLRGHEDARQHLSWAEGATTDGGQGSVGPRSD